MYSNVGIVPLNGYEKNAVNKKSSTGCYANWKSPPLQSLGQMAWCNPNSPWPRWWSDCKSQSEWCPHPLIERIEFQASFADGPKFQRATHTMHCASRLVGGADRIQPEQTIGNRSALHTNDAAWSWVSSSWDFRSYLEKYLQKPSIEWRVDESRKLWRGSNGER